MTKTSGHERVSIGAPLPRLEDERFLTGRGCYVDDLDIKGLAYAYVVRAEHAHARLIKLDKEAALRAPGVIAVLTGEDALADGIVGLACNSFPTLPAGNPSYCPVHPILAVDKVRHVGDRVVLIVAETLNLAKDAGALLNIEYEPLPAVTLTNALEPNAEKVWDDAASNVSFEREFGDGQAVDQAFRKAAHISTLTVHYPCVSANSIEPRGTLAYRDPADGRLTLYSSTQMPFRVREAICELLRMSPLDLRVKAVDVGGAFGMKGQIYPEDILAVWAAKKLGRPVKWIADRNESLASDMHGRSQIATGELALDESGRILAFRTVVAVDVGAYLSRSAGTAPNNAGLSYPGTYKVPLVHAVVRATFTNTAQLGPYRGSGKPEASFMLERLIDNAAHDMGIDAIELRRRNLIRTSDMPYKTFGNYIYDTGDFEGVLDKALLLADWGGFPARRAASSGRGLLRGIGISLHCQRAGTANERMEIRIDHTGSIGIYAGTFATGQGHETVYAQMVADWLGAPLSKIRVFQGDTDTVLFGRGTFAQRSMSAGGSALKLAADNVIEKGRRFAAWMLEASEMDIQFDSGVFRVIGTDKQLTLTEIAAASYAGFGIPEGLGLGLDGIGSHTGPYTYPNGCMVCEVEVDAATGKVNVERLSAVDDVGAVINPLLLEGQLHGSIAQGLGEALLEELVYDAQSAQLLTGSFMDYGMPRADMMPEIASEVALVAAKTNLLGSKGGSEAGNVAVPAAVINAILNALSEYRIRDIALPATPERIWRAVHTASNKVMVSRGA